MITKEIIRFQDKVLIVKKRKPNHFLFNLNTNDVNNELLNLWAGVLNANVVVHINNEFVFCQEIEELEIL